MTVCARLSLQKGCPTLLELAKPLAVLSSILSLLVLFDATFLRPAISGDERLYDALIPLLLAAAISLIGGLVFQAEMRRSSRRIASLMGTFPMQIFCWTTAGIALLFLLSWYIETHCVFYRDLYS